MGVFGEMSDFRREEKNEDLRDSMMECGRVLYLSCLKSRFFESEWLFCIPRQTNEERERERESVCRGEWRVGEERGERREREGGERKRGRGRKRDCLLKCGFFFFFFGDEENRVRGMGGEDFDRANKAFARKLI